MKVDRLYDQDNQYIVYRQIRGTRASIVFLGGFGSDMNGTKATAIYKFCQAHDLSLVLFDYFGHGTSSGHFTDYTISDWKQNCIEIISQLTIGKQIIIGSSMGGWLMCLIAMQLPQTILALIGISCAIDFTQNLIFEKLSDQQKIALSLYGMIHFSAHDNENCTYQITKELIEDGRNNLLLTKNLIEIYCPVRLLHSLNDKDVPYHTSLNLAHKIASNDVEIHLIKSASHNMSDNTSIEKLFKIIKELLSSVI
ncbi:alpha/beta hydrolase [Wolbachia endosymbiont of Howardula sp.]|uniref:alpha/beta hydrolase n=1 Tax=Wolbachia endosymbiont of Howardula sp. TaxID=2916816 RepID=UPI00217DD6A7|nr:alpha/beta hydrolase [Wolbachia endosymbiont of Howardula sp.]UWI83390.1 alpha/beta hydrolase [Wolbachia endosymbiont of Howardula sp.]